MLVKQANNKTMRFISPPLRYLKQAIMPQQRIYARFATSECGEGLHRAAAAAHRQYLAAKARADVGIQHAVLFKQTVCIGGQHLRPLVAVIARRITPRKNMREAVRKAMERGRDQHRYF